MKEIWQPLSIQEISNIFSKASVDWAIAGGYALDLYLGESYRPHGDIDVIFFRTEQTAVRTLFPGWEVMASHPPGDLRPWDQQEVLPENVNNIWIRKNSSLPWCLQLMMMDEVDGSWVYRRDPKITLPKHSIIGRFKDDVPALNPEIQLLYKSKSPRDKDELDFSKIVPKLNTNSRNWLRDSLQKCYPLGHPWLDSLRGN